MKQNVTKNQPKKANIFFCEICDYSTCKISNFKSHLLTGKHLVNHNCNTMKQNISQKKPIYKCYCDKEYNNRTSLWRHKKICTIVNEQNEANEENQDNNEHSIPELNNEIILELIKQNQEFKELLIEQNNKIIEMAKEKSIINSNNNNNHFNLNVFLNEQCKDALNIMDFINTLTVHLEDLENTGKNGYVQGITKIFVRGLKELDVTKRPIHCSDLKRETLYVKDTTWEKDNEKKQMKKAIRYIADKNFKQLNSWVSENPESKDIESKKHLEYMRIINKSTGGMTNEEDDENFNKIIKNVAKEVVIDK
jgi:hypothetical protein